jgi:hypothetical protein
MLPSDFKAKSKYNVKINGSNSPLVHYDKDKQNDIMEDEQFLNPEGNKY